MQKFLVILLLLGLTVSLSASKYAGDFLQIGLGVKAIGMGYAYTGVADDGSAIYFNPAGIGQIRDIQFELSHAFLFKNLATYDSFTGIIPLPNNVSIAANWTRLTVPDIPFFSENYLLGTTVDQRSAFIDLHLPGQTSEYFDDTDDIYQFTFAKNIHHDLNLGWYFFKVPVDLYFAANVKYIKRDIRTHTGTGTGFDLGVLTRTNLAILLDIDRLGDISFGTTFKDLGGTTVTWDTESKHEDEILQTRRAGVALFQPIPQWNTNVVLASDINFEYSEVWNYGLDIEYKKLVSLRAGMTNKDFTSGLSLNLFRFTMDYAFVTNSLGFTNRVGLRFRY
ncbi:MAG: hypothetical protein K8S56_08485 [Candidatus Cloacimonetes bacterium]|nr:hypothetical protein [Candidatus Cloacimonadota bacterium]